ncbi:MAG: protein translocase subunit SecF [Candidatus Kapabacteria bacterium]|nr:protein translocase subunit SecF [Candidatus Kapabacteria bacterium]
MEFFHGTNIDFVGKRLLFFVISAVATAFGLLAVFVIGIDYGIDFRGGTEIQLTFNKTITTEQLRHTISSIGIEGAEIKSLKSGEAETRQYIIRILQSEGAANKVFEAMEKDYPGARIPGLTKIDDVGPKIGGELKKQAFIAVFLSVIAILLYIAFRFEFIWGLGAIIALLHDVLFTFSMLVIVQKTGIIKLEVDLSMLAAMLTVIGFSVNDTVIVFDRIRENKTKHKGMNFVKLINLSINETLSRTINTVLTVVMVLTTMVLFGGEVLRGFSFTMLVGIIVGTYSSIYIASSYVIWHLEKFKKMDFTTVEKNQPVKVKA